MFVRRTVSILAVVLFALAVPSGNDLVFAVDQALTSICHDSIWDNGEYCGRDAAVTTGTPDMNHDCLVDGLDVGLFMLQYGSSGPNLSGDFNDNNQVNLVDYAYFLTKIGMTASPCNGVQIPSVCDGTIALSFSSNPSTIVNNASQGTGTHTAYIVIDNIANARIIEYSLLTSSNVVVTSQTPFTPGNISPMCQTDNGQVIALSASLASGPATIAMIEYQLTDTNPASLTIAPALCSWGRVRWTTAQASLSHEFSSISHAGINGPTPGPSSCTGPTEVGTISGNVYADIAGPCVFDSGTDFGIEYIMVQFTPGPFHAVTDGTGDYEIQLPPGSYTVSLAPGAVNDPWKYFSGCQSPTYAVNVVANGTVAGKDFALKPVGTIAGRVFNDFDDDCVFDVGVDMPVAGQMVATSPGGFIGYTDETGNYSIVVPVGSYNVMRSFVSNDPWVLGTCQTSIYGVDVEALSTEPGNDFALTWTGPPHCETSVHVVSHGFYVGAPCVFGHDTMVTPCPGIEHEYLFSVISEPTSVTPVPAGAYVTIGLNSVFTLGTITSDFPITVEDIGGNFRLVYLGADLMPGQSFVIKVRATPSGDGPYEASAQFIDNGCTGGTTEALLVETDQCSCDPNDLAVAPKGCGPNGDIVGDTPMTYTVRFENIGNGAAHNIQIFNVLDSDLDLSTLEILDSSHPITGYQVAFGNTLAIGFEGIDLPGALDPENAKGYVVFSIDPKPNLADGTTIQNTASITFDFNEPVVTNTTLNTIRAVPCPTTDVPPPSKTVVHALGQNHPNPFNPMTTIEYSMARGEHVSISIYNIEGELVRTLVSAVQPAGQHYVEWNGRDQGGNPVASGVYLYRMHAGSFVDTKKLVLLK